MQMSRLDSTYMFKSISSDYIKLCGLHVLHRYPKELIQISFRSTYMLKMTFRCYYASVTFLLCIFFSSEQDELQSFGLH